MLRWILVLPGGLLGAAAFSLIMSSGQHYVWYMVAFGPPGPIFQFLMGIETFFLLGLGFVGVGAVIAPSRRTATALTLLGLVVLYAGSQLTIAALRGDARSAVLVVFSLAGAAIAFLATGRWESDEEDHYLSALRWRLESRRHEARGLMLSRIAEAPEDDDEDEHP